MNGGLNSIAKMNFSTLGEFRRSYRKLIWRGMMAGDGHAWGKFFEHIESGTARLILAENSPLPPAWYAGHSPETFLARRNA